MPAGSSTTGPCSSQAAVSLSHGVSSSAASSSSATSASGHAQSASSAMGSSSASSGVASAEHHPPQEPVEKRWRVLVSPEGKPYWFNIKANATQWELPPEQEVPKEQAE